MSLYKHSIKIRVHYTRTNDMTEDIFTYVTLYEKIKTVSILLWEAERENSRLKQEIADRDAIIKDLNIDIYFSDLELQDIKQQVDNSRDVNYMHSLLEQIRDLSKSNDLLLDMVNKEITF